MGRNSISVVHLDKSSCVLIANNHVVSVKYIYGRVGLLVLRLTVAMNLVTGDDKDRVLNSVEMVSLPGLSIGLSGAYAVPKSAF